MRFWLLVVNFVLGVNSRINHHRIVDADRVGKKVDHLSVGGRVMEKGDNNVGVGGMVMEKGGDYVGVGGHGYFRRRKNCFDTGNIRVVFIFIPVSVIVA